MDQTQVTPNPDPIYSVGPDEWLTPDSYLPHWVRLPGEASLARPAPVVVMIHGWGGDENAMWVFKQAIPPGVAIITPRAPLPLTDEDGYSWYWRDETNLQPKPDSLWAGVSRLRCFLADLSHQYPLDPARLFLVGFSQGAAMANTLAITRPGLTAGVASLSGFMPNLIAETPVNGSLAGFPVFIAHGVRDEVIPLTFARQAQSLYTRLGAVVTYNEYSTGHKMTTQGITELKQWLQSVVGLFPNP